MIAGHGQEAGLSYAAREVSYRAESGIVEFSLDIAGAYPPEAGVGSWRRSVVMHRGSGVWLEIVDTFRLTRPGAISFHLMIPAQPMRTSEGLLVGVAGGRDVLVSADWHPKISWEELDLSGDPRLRAAWGPSLYRVMLRVPDPKAEGKLLTRVRQIG
jgi:hypothetical protein